MKFDAIVVGGGLSGLTAASLLAKRGLKVVVIDKNYNPGGSCGIFKRENTIFDQGSAMLYGFGERGFNSHRFLFNCLEEPINVIKHDLLYCVNFKGKRIRFWADIDKFVDELSFIFPHERENIKRFYRDLSGMYQDVMVESPSYTSADERDPKESLQGLMKHPLSYIKFLSYLNKSAEDLLRKYFTDPEILKFFDKLTSTYCYTTVKESPAILASVMFVDNHIGGSYYPAGSTIFLPGKLEKVIEAHGGTMLLEKEVMKILFTNGKPGGVRLSDGTELFAENIVYSGTVWNLYGKLINPGVVSPKRLQWVANQVPTYPSVILYAIIEKTIIPEDTAPIEMLVGNPDAVDESEVTVYILSIDDHTLCNQDVHTVVAIGPSFLDWKTEDKDSYQSLKEKEQKRLIAVLEKRFPGFTDHVRYAEIATPLTIERYCNKNGGAVAGPKQMLGQHMLNRLHTRTEWDTLYCCGESTVMGTGTPAVTTSGISAANAILKKLGLAQFKYHDGMNNHVQVLEKPYKSSQLYQDYPEDQRQVMLKAYRCQYCEAPACSKGDSIDIRGIMRRVTVGNFLGAKKIVLEYQSLNRLQTLSFHAHEQRCILNQTKDDPVEIQEVVDFLLENKY